MAESYDTAARLADGLPTVADLASYVSASQALGYRHPDLTEHPAQVRDWYASEDGMSLTALESDCAALQTVSVMAEEALAAQDAQRLLLATAWQGGGAQASGEFLRRHSDACGDAAAAVRTAAQALAALRDRLWGAVDGKVTTVLAIDEGVRARRAEWLAAAQTVTTGAGDRSVASELVDQEIKPFVDNVIGGQWLTAMRAAIEAIEAAYGVATAELASGADSPFEVPGGLGPTWTPPADGEVAESGAVAAPPGGFASSGSASGGFASGGFGPTANAAPVSPAGWSPAGGWGASAAPTPPAAPPPPPLAPPTVPPPVDPGQPSPMGAPSLGGGLPDIGSGLAGFGQQLGDVLGSLLGNGDTELDPPELDEPEDLDEPDAELDEAEDDGATDSEESEEDSEDPSAPDGLVDPNQPVEPAADATCPPEPSPPALAEGVPEEPAATPPPEPLADVPERSEPESPAGPPPAESASDSGTPCEIAAHELPQVGE